MLALLVSAYLVIGLVASRILWPPGGGIPSWTHSLTQYVATTLAWPLVFAWLIVDMIREG